MKKFLTCIAAGLFLASCQSQVADVSSTTQTWPNIVQISSHTNVPVESIHPDLLNPALLVHIEKVANAVENGYTPYEWTDYRNCNVGLFVQSTLDYTPTQVDKAWNHWCNDYDHHADVMAKERNYAQASWKNMVGYYTGLNQKATNNVFVQELVKAGLTLPVVSSLEFLSDKTILKQAGATSLNFSTDADYVRYLRAWVKVIKAHRIQYTNTIAIR